MGTVVINSLISTNFSISLGFVLILALISSYFSMMARLDLYAFLAISISSPLAAILYLAANFSLSSLKCIRKNDTWILSGIFFKSSASFLYNSSIYSFSESISFGCSSSSFSNCFTYSSGFNFNTGSNTSNSLRYYTMG